MARQKENAFALVELLVVIGVIAILASLLLPALTRAKSAAAAAHCKSNLRQVSLALVNYADAWGVYPLSDWPANPDWTTHFIWPHFLAWDAFPDTTGDPRGLAKLARVLLCPILSPSQSRGFFQGFPGPDYAYNSQGLGYWNSNLGLGGTFPERTPFDKSTDSIKYTRDSDVKVPSDMIAIGDPFRRSLAPRFDGVRIGWWALAPRGIVDPPGSGASMQPNYSRNTREFKAHGGKFNRAFCDGHVEVENFNLPLAPTDDYLKRWNNDNEPHRGVWH